jgi:arylsulfatase A-like enzyme
MGIGRKYWRVSSKLFLAVWLGAGTAGVPPLPTGAADVPASGQSPASAPRGPNIIFILADDLGYGDLGCYGQTRIRTPHLDQMAADGIRFTQCYAGSTVCAPSRAVLMTGRHTGHVSIRGNADVPLASHETTVAEVLKSRRYLTGCFGKWGLGLEKTSGTPKRKGFDEWFGYLDQTHAHDYYPTQLWRSSTIAQVEDMPKTIEANLQGAQGAYSHDLFTQAAQNFLRFARREPFFLYLAYTIPHANNELKERGMQVPLLDPYAKEEWPPAEKAKAAMITRMDRDIGRLLELLKTFRVDSNTVVFFSSDNGPHKESGVNPEFFKSAGPLRGIKRDLYEGGIRVPMIARWPGRIPAGTVSDQVWTFWDFLPTVAELAGAEVPPGVDGRSIVPALFGQRVERSEDFLYWEFHEQGSKQAVRLGDWKGIRQRLDAPLELYRLSADRGETNNIAAAHPEMVGRMESYLKTARTESPTWPLRAPPARGPGAQTIPNPRPN